MNRVGIVISNYNYGRYILSAIDSVLNQTVPCDIYVVNDGSTDNSMDIISDYLGKYERLSQTKSKSILPFYDGYLEVTTYINNNIQVINCENSGASTARNIGICLSDNEYIGILDADDMYRPNKVEVLLEALVDDTHICVAYADYIRHMHGFTKEEYKKSYSYEGLQKECIVHSGALIRMSALEQVKLENGEYYKSALHGPGGEDFIGCTEDYDLWLRLSRVGMIHHEPQILSEVREHGENQSMKMTPEIFQNNIKLF